jgi:Cytochrome P460
MDAASRRSTRSTLAARTKNRALGNLMGSENPQPLHACVKCRPLQSQAEIWQRGYNAPMASMDHRSARSGKAEDIRLAVAFRRWYTRIAFLLIAIVTAAGVVTVIAPASGQAVGEAVPIFGIKIPLGYRDWRLVSVAHEEGNLNDIRAILGNDVAIKAYREEKLPFPDGSIIARIAWNYVRSEENNIAFGRRQSFVAGSAAAAHLQLMVKDSKKYAATGGWGFAQFDKDGKPADAAPLKTCFPCHQAIKDRDFVFTRYSR